MNSALVLGGMAAETAAAIGFTGEIDELRLANTAFLPAAVKLGFINQSGSEAALRLLSLGQAEGGEAASSSHVLEHVMLFGDIANNMMFDGWIAVGICVIMIVIGWTVAIKKFVYLNKIEKGNKEFLRLWKSISTDLTALDHADANTIKSMGGSVDEEDQELMKDSPLYHIYHIGSEEIGHRIHKMSAKQEGLPGRSIQAIRASLDAGLVHENHRLTDGLVYLTISVAGGPYVGLLGTVVGVMITFAIIAKSGEVNVNSIAPGIASALLATVVGLIVAIPALFIYSYLNGRIKNVVSTMQVFIDEFVAKMAEFYRPSNESEPENSGR
jgi:biopolymer transport protein ExbB